MSDYERSMEHTLILMEAERNTWKARAEKAEAELARLREGIKNIPTCDGPVGGLVYWQDLAALLEVIP